MTTDDAGRLMEWMRDQSIEMARALRAAGWWENCAGLWFKDGAGHGLHIFDAHEKMKRGLATQGRVVR